MARLLVLLLTVLLVLPTLTQSASCPVTVKQTKTTTSNYVEYSATATNSGSTPVSSIQLDPSGSLKTMSLSKNSAGNYLIPDTLAVGASYSFTFSVKKGNTITWSSICTASSTPQTAAPTTKAPAKATDAPAKVTTAPSKATTAPNTGGRFCPAGSWWAPAPLTTWQWQITGKVDTSINVQMYDVDLFELTTSLSETLHAQGRVVICYFSTQYENWRPDASIFPASVIGSALDGWPGENYVDIRAAASRAAINARLDLAVSKGCDGVEPDNVDGYTAKSGFPVTAADQLSFNQYIAQQSHARGLSVGLKNDVDQIAALQPYFDWALNEQCKQYSECGVYTAFTNNGKAVFNAEYKGTGSSVCPALNTAKISALVKTLDLTAQIIAQCCTSLNNCAPAPYTCKTGSSKRDLEEINFSQIEQEQITEQVTEQQLAEKQSPSVVLPEYLFPIAASSSTTASMMVLSVVAIVALCV